MNQDKEFYALGKRMFDRLNPPGTIRPAPLPDWKAEYLKTVDLHCQTLDELREAQADLKEARHANEKHIARIVDLQTHIANLEGEEHMRKSLHLTTEFWPRKWPCFAVGFVSSGNEFVLHLYVICFRIKWGY